MGLLPDLLNSIKKYTLPIHPMYNLKRNIFRTIRAALLGVASLTALTGCDSLINDDLDPCPEGVVLRFVYDYNMEFANAFPSQVDCLTLLVYDDQGRLVESRTETSSVLADENYRMTIDLPAATYHFVAYGGMACENTTFHFVDQPVAGSQLSQLAVSMNANCISANPGVDLHPLFYGDLDLTIDPKTMAYTPATVYMMKDTNTLRILLQNVDGTPVNAADFTFAITDNNTLLNWQNDVVPTAEGITYSPWATGQAGVGANEAGDEALVAYAEFSTSRLMAGSDARLVIKRVSDGRNVLSVPLVNYLLLLKSLHFDKMGPQEFLDRESRWNMILFLENGRWLDTHIVINDWIVRINNAEL